MTNKNKTKMSKADKRLLALQRKMASLSTQIPKKKTPFRDVGGIVGNAVSKYTGFSGASGIGKWLGTGIGSIFGSGDYQMVGQSPDYNVLTSSKQIPKFSTTHASNIVCHREYLGDIVGTAGFNNNTYPINPGMSQTFPWLSTVAQNYQEYRLHGLIFEFRPLITDFVTSGAPGVVIMATNYNADSAAYATKQAMENTEFAVSVKPTLPLIHAVECAGDENPFKIQYVRTGALPTGQDLKSYDLGLFQFATQANPTQALGELWVSYCVEFLKPTLPSDIGGVVQSGHVYRNTTSAANPFGTIGVFVRGTLSMTVTGTAFTFTAAPAQLYQLSINWTSGGAAAVAAGTLTYTNAVVINAYNDNTVSVVTQPQAGTVSVNMTYIVVVRCTALVPTVITVAASAFTVPTNAGLDIVVTELGATSL